MTRGVVKSVRGALVAALLSLLPNLIAAQVKIADKGEPIVNGRHVAVYRAGVYGAKYPLRVWMREPFSWGRRTLISTFRQRPS